jgi:hypothetical protein
MTDNVERAELTDELARTAKLPRRQLTAGPQRHRQQGFFHANYGRNVRINRVEQR